MSAAANAPPLEKGIAFAQQARAADDAGQLEQALYLYTLCLEWLDVARKHTPEPAKKHIANAMVSKFQRAEELQAQLRSARKPEAMTTTEKKDSEALRTSLSSALLSERPTTRLDDVVGLEDVKQALREAVLVPVQAPQLFRGRASPWLGILLYGPPGTGKTHIARAIAGEAGCTFFSVSASDIVNKYVGESERLVRALFEMARGAKPAIVFIDEIESILPSRSGGGGGAGNGGDSSSNHMDRVVTEFLKQLDGLGIDNEGVLMLAATNIPWQIDAAALRRFDRRIYVPLPGPEARAKMLSPDLMQIGGTPQQVIDLVAATEGYSGSDIKNLLKEGSMRSLRRVLDATHFCPAPNEVGAVVPCDPDTPGAVACSYAAWKEKHMLRCPDSTPQDYLDALQVVQSSVKQAGLERFNEWAATK
jgi:vacuolar protein-sorting-associated protein 4